MSVDFLSNDSLVNALEQGLQPLSGENFEGQTSPLAQELVFIDANLENYEHLITALDDQAAIFVIDPTEDGVTQISNILESYQDLETAHIITHGDQGAIALGSTLLTPETIETHQQQLKSWGSAFAEEGDLLFYGCNIAKGREGQDFINQIADLTGTDVAGSDDLTGSQGQGGDATLEYVTGEIESSSLDAAVFSDYQGVLLAGSASDNEDTFTFETSDWGSTLEIDGLEGNDSLSFAEFTEALTFSLSQVDSDTFRLEVADNGTNSAVIEATSIETIIGGEGNDLFTFGAIGTPDTAFNLAETGFAIQGNAGTDTIEIAENQEIYLEGGLSLNAERITVPENTTISATG